MDYETKARIEETQQSEADEQATEEEQPKETKLLFETLKANPNYSISKNIYPYIIRRKSNHHIVSVWKNGNGYERITLNGKKYYYHRVIATQWLDNPNNYPEIDHIDRNPMNNRLNNLRWVSSSENLKNKTIYNGIDANYEDELSEDAIEVNEYGKHKFEFLYFDNDKFYYYTGAAYRELYYNTDKRSGALYVNVRDINHKHAAICLNKFKKLYNLI